MGQAGRWTAVGVWIVMMATATAADPKAGGIAEADYSKLVAQQTKTLTETLKAALASTEMLEKKRLADKAKVVAILLAQAAQDNLAGADAGQRATLRDAALAIAKQLPANGPQFADALKLAEALDGLKADPAAKKEKIPLLPAHINLSVLMVPFKNADKGGHGLEATLIKLSFDKKKMIPAAQQGDPLLLSAYQTALIAELTRDHKPAKEEKKWQELSDDMRRTALEMADGIRAKDGKAAFAALVKLNESCTICHKLYRDEDK